MTVTPWGTRTTRRTSAQGYREVRNNVRDSVTGRGHYNPKSSRHEKVVRKTMFEKKPSRRDRTIRTPFRDKARDHSTERVTGAELRKRTLCYRCRQLGHHERVSESSTEGYPSIFSQELLFARRCFRTVA